MIRVRSAFVVSIVIITLLATMTLCYCNWQITGVIDESQDNNTISQDDNIVPNIWAWGITGRANESVPFIVWANVTDDGVGVKNVSVHINAPNYTLVEELLYNGSFYERLLDPFLFPGEYRLIVRAFDMNNNTRTGGIIYVTIVPPEEIPIDEGLTMPVVVATSVLLAIIVLMAAMLYDKRIQSSD